MWVFQKYISPTSTLEVHMHYSLKTPTIKVVYVHSGGKTRQSCAMQFYSELACSTWDATVYSNSEIQWHIETDKGMSRTRFLVYLQSAYFYIMHSLIERHGEALNSPPFSPSRWQWKRVPSSSKKNQEKTSSSDCRQRGNNRKHARWCQ